MTCHLLLHIYIYNVSGGALRASKQYGISASFICYRCIVPPTTPYDHIMCVARMPRVRDKDGTDTLSMHFQCYMPSMRYEYAMRMTSIWYGPRLLLTCDHCVPMRYQCAIAVLSIRATNMLSMPQSRAINVAGRVGHKFSQFCRRQLKRFFEKFCKH